MTKMKTTKRPTKQARADAHAAEMQKLTEFRQRIAERGQAAQERMRHRPPGTIDGEFSVYLMLQAAYGMSEAGTRWLLRNAGYRPPEVEGTDVEVLGFPNQRIATAWNEGQIHAAALTFIAECMQETKTLWSHPRVKGRFKLRHGSCPG